MVNKAAGISVIEKGLHNGKPNSSISSIPSSKAVCTSCGNLKPGGWLWNNLPETGIFSFIFLCRKLASQSNSFLFFLVKRKAPVLIRIFNCSIPMAVRSIKSCRCKKLPHWSLSCKMRCTVFWSSDLIWINPMYTSLSYIPVNSKLLLMQGAWICAPVLRSSWKYNSVE